MSSDTIQPSRFFVIGGTLGRATTSYIQRPADDDLFRLTLEGEYCNVLAARQTGKSSLMVRTAERLKNNGVKPVIVDLTAIGSKVSADEWFFGLISYLNRDLNLNIDEQAWWHARKDKSPVQRFSDFLLEIILKEIQGQIVIFIDEIDSTLKLEFTDDFFAAIRAVYNARSQNTDLKRLTFVLLGVARPADLIKDHTRTPYNIGVGIDITDFQIQELDVFESVLEKTCPGMGRQVLEWVLEWTDGQPYLTQKLSSEVVKQASDSFSKDQLDNLVEQLFLGDKARTETNLRSIRDQTSKHPRLAKMLSIYKRVLANKQVLAEERSIEQNELKLTGLVKTTPQGTLQVRNRIYAHTFNESWVKANMPRNVAQRLTIIATIIAVLAIGVAGYFYFQQQTQTARTYVDSFNNSASPDVKITSLAGLFGLGDQYAGQARGLFDALDYEHKLALFNNLATPSNVGNELAIVADGVYQNVENTTEGNTLLRAIATVLRKTESIDALKLEPEITAWIDGREAADNGKYSTAIDSYNRAFKYSKDRGNENAAILIDRAVAHTMLKQYAETFADYDDAIRIDANRANEIKNAILGNQLLVKYLRENLSNYPNLLNSISIPTEPPIQAPTPTPTQVPIPTIGIGSIMKSEKDGMTVLYVPASDFTMGNDNGAPNEKPVHTVYLDAFWIDQTEVTNKQYAACVTGGGCTLPSNTSSFRRARYYGTTQFDEFPVIYVDWSQANAYCSWVGRELPSEAQWENAARGTNANIYPWGNDAPNWNLLNYNNNVVDTTKVGSYETGKSFYGAYDMAGNVWEWVSSLYKPYPYDASDGRENMNSSGMRVLRGGSWNFFEGSVRSTFRLRNDPSNSFSIAGFRCASSP